MSQGEQVQLRYNYLMNVSKDAQGDFVRTSDGFANQLRILQLQISENARALGEKLLPYVTSLVSWVNKNIDTIKQWGTVLLTIVGILGLMKIVNTIVVGIKAWKSATTGLTLAQSLFNGTMFACPITWVIMGIMALVVALVVAYNKCEGFRNAVDVCWNFIKQATMVCWGAIVTFFTTTIPNAFSDVVQFFSKIGDNIKNVWYTCTDYICGYWRLVVAFFTEDIPNFCNNFVNWFKDIPNKIGALWENIKQFFINGWNTIVNFFVVGIPQFISNVLTFFDELPPKLGYMIGFCVGKFIKFGLDLIQWAVTNVPIIVENIVTFFKELPSKIWIWLSNVVSKVITWGSNMLAKGREIAINFVNAVVDFIRSLPNKIWTWLSNTLSKIINWGSNMVSKGREVATNFVNAVIQFIQQLPSKIWTWLSNTFEKIVTWGSNMVSKGREAMGQFCSAVVSAVQDLPSKFVEIGGNIVRGVWNGITGMASWIKDKIFGFFGGMVQGAKDALGIHSPSRVFRDQVGKFMAQGVGVGFENEMTDVQRTIQGSLETTVKPIDVKAVNFNKDMGNNMLTTMCELMQELVNKDVIIKTEQGREFARLVAPYQNEVQRYNNRSLRGI